jgi:type III pantothenate kinase
MWLVIDIGNSAAKGAFFTGEVLHDPFRVEQHSESGAWEATLAERLRDRPVARIGIASVVPSVTTMLAPLLHRLTGAEAQVIRHTMRLPFRLAYETPHTMGTDRLAAAAAAWTGYGTAPDGTARPVVALDAGTAVTYEVVDRDGVFLGGTIGAGPRLLRDALNSGTAQLPAVPLELPPTPIGRSTQEALQAGILFGFVDGVRGLLARLPDTLGEEPFVVATGGWATFLHTHLDEIDHVDPHLVLRGIQVLMALNET